MKNIVYVSSAVRLLSDAQLLDILTISRQNNRKHNVTGVLLYSEGIFIQVLEGEDADVDHVINKIEMDTRHKNLITLIDAPIIHKSFAEWWMGFTTPNAEKFNDVLGYLQSLTTLSQRADNTPAVATIKTFIESNKLTVTY